MCISCLYFHTVFFLNINSSIGKTAKINFFVERIAKTVDAIDFKYVLIANKIDSKTSVDDLLQFAIDNLSHKSHAVRLACVIIVRQLSPELIARDVKLMQSKSETISSSQQKENNAVQPWHLLHKLEPTIAKYDERLKQHLAKYVLRNYTQRST